MAVLHWEQPALIDALTVDVEGVTGHDGRNDQRSLLAEGLNTIGAAVHGRSIDDESDHLQQVDRDGRLPRGVSPRPGRR